MLKKCGADAKIFISVIESKLNKKFSSFSSQLMNIQNHEEYELLDSIMLSPKKNSILFNDDIEKSINIFKIKLFDEALYIIRFSKGVNLNNIISSNVYAIDTVFNMEFFLYTQNEIDEEKHMEKIREIIAANISL